MHGQDPNLIIIMQIVYIITKKDRFRGKQRQEKNHESR